MSRNFGAAADDYARHRAGFPEELFDRLAALGIGREGQRVVDLGTGTGTLARGLARAGCQVIGIDPDTRLLEQARILDAAAGVVVDYREGRAEQTGLPGTSADLVSAGQCWHWFEPEAAAQEIRRILVSDGTLLIAHFDWLPLAGNVVEATEALILARNPGWAPMAGSNGFHVESLPFLHRAGFGAFETFSFDLDVAYTPEAWRGRIRASAGVGASLDVAAVAEFDAALAQLLATHFPGSALQVPHRVFALIARRIRAQ